MQIVIDIDTVDYEYIKNGCIIPIKIDNHIYNAIRNGIPLPEGHGRIADMDEAIKCIEEVKGEDAIYTISLIEWACGKRTIIEADKEESED